MRSAGFALLVQRRLSSRDRSLLLVLAVLTLLTVVCALGGPRLLTGTLDDSVRRIVAADPDADVVVSAPVGRPLPGSDRLLVDPDDVAALPGQVRRQLPPALRRATAPATAAVTGPDVRLTPDDADPALRNGPIGVQLALLPRLDAVRLRAGALPATDSTRGVVDVVLSQAVADATSLRLGSTMDLPVDEAAGDAPLRLRVTGVVERVPVSGPSPWTDLGPVWAARENRNGTAAPLQVVALTDTTGIGDAAAALGPFTARLRLHVLPARLTAAEAPRVAAQAARLQTHPDEALPAAGGEAVVRSSLPDAVARAQERARSATAQILLLGSGVLGAGGVAIVLVGGLVAGRRRETVALQRARGASVVAIAAPAVLESAALVVVTSLIAVLVTGQAMTAAALVVAAVAVLAVPVRIAASARGAVVRRTPANRSDRSRLRRLRSARRLAAELAVVVVAVVALLVLDASGAIVGSEPNPLLLVAPLLVAAAATLVVSRLLPPAVRAAAAPARRSRGVAGVLVAARAAKGGAALPLLALCIALGLALNDGVLLASVDAGQEAAAWDRVGADARASTAVDVQRVAARPGVRQTSALAVMPGTSVDLRTTSTTVTLLGVDGGYPGVVAALPTSMPATAAVLRRLGDGSGSGPLPVVVDAEVARQMVGRTLQLQLDSGPVPARAVGTVPDGPGGWQSGPFVFADLDALRRRSADAVPTSALVVGPGAGAALRATGVPADEVLTRTGWLAALRAEPLVAGVRLAVLLAAGLLAVLAAAALAAAVLAGAPDRRRTLGLLRTLGMRRRTGWWLLVADLLPLVAGGVLGGAAIGVVAAQVFDPALALAGLTGGREDPAVVVSGPVLGLVLLGAVLVLAAGVGVEAMTWRRDRFAEVLRVGGR